MNERPLLEVRDLSVRFHTDEGVVSAVDGVSFDVPKRCTVALVGESGSGKSVTAHSIMRLLPTPPAELTGGSILLDGVDLLSLPERQMRAIRGARVSIVFQDPMSSLNPVFSVGAQLAEAYLIHGKASRRQARQRSIELLARVGFPEPEQRFDAYPHELSGGMRQRVMIAIALACQPDLIIADEPTTALDMLAAAQIGALLAELEHERDMSVLFISHDIGQVAERADQLVVLYAGQVAERGATASVLTTPRHPYTRALLDSIPPLRTERRRRTGDAVRLPALGAAAASARARAQGCRFADRCPEVFDRCHGEEPPLVELEPGWWARCFLAADERAVPLTRPSYPRADLASEPRSDDEDLQGETDDDEEALETALDKDIEHTARTPRPKLADRPDHDDDGDGTDPSDGERDP